MSFEQKFDNIIKRKFEQAESEFSFDENNWEKASKMIEAERAASKVKNSKVFLFYGAIMLLIGTAGFFAFKYVSVNNNNAEIANTNNINHLSESRQAYTKSNESEFTENTAENTSSSNKKAGENVLIDNSGNSSPIESKTNGSKKTQYIAENNISGTSNLLSTNKNKTFVNGSPARKSSSGQKSSSDITLNKNSGKIKSASNRDFANLNNPYQHSYDGKSTNAVKEPLLMSGSVTEYDEVYTNNNNHFWLAGKVTTLPPSHLDSGLKNTAYDFIRIYQDEYFKAKRRKLHYLNLEAGTAYLFGWDVPKGKDAKGFNVFAGLNYGLHLSKKISLSSGAQVYNVSNIQQPFYTGSNVTYDFGANGTYTNIASNSLYYAAIPLKINYAVTGRDRIALGVNTGFLFNAVNTVETFTMLDGSKINVQKDRVTGYYEGINPVNIMLTASYSHSVGKRIRFNGEFVYALSDTYKNTSSNSIKENNLGVRLSMQYTLFDK